MSAASRPPPDQPAERPLILDDLGNRLEQFRLLYDSDSEATDDILNELGGQGRVEREMLRELAATRTLARPERFLEAHGVAMRALEVLARNGARPPSQLRSGPFTPVVRFLVQQVIRFIVRSHQGQVFDAIRDLYARRLAWMPTTDPSRMALVRARLDVERATLAFKKKAGGVPAFLVGGAAVSSITQGLRGAASAAGGSAAGLVVAALATFLLVAVIAWVVLRGAAVARRRIRLTLDRPLAALWQTVGWCGNPPKDNARMFAAIAVALTVVGWVVIPAVAVSLVALL